MATGQPERQAGGHRNRGRRSSAPNRSSGRVRLAGHHELVAGARGPRTGRPGRGRPRRTSSGRPPGIGAGRTARRSRSPGRTPSVWLDPARRSSCRPRGGARKRNRSRRPSGRSGAVTSKWSTTPCRLGGRSPGTSRRDLGLADDDDAVVGVDGPAGRRVQQRRHAVVADDGRERAPRSARPVRRQHRAAWSWLDGAPPVHHPVDPDGPDRQALQIQVELGQVLRRARQDRAARTRRACRSPGRRDTDEVEVVAGRRSRRCRTAGSRDRRRRAPGTEVRSLPG